MKQTNKHNKLADTYRKHWGSPQVLVQDKKDLAPVVELDTVVGVRHMEGHYDGTRRNKL